MIRPIVRLLATGVLVLAPVHLAAQGIGLGVGTLVPQGDLAEGAKTGFVGIASLEFGSRTSLRIEALWANSSLDGRIISDGSGVPLPSNADVSGDVQFIGGLASLVFHLGEGPVRPYLMGGAGYYNRDVSQKASDAAGNLGELSLKESELGFHVGAGLKLTVFGISAFGEARYHTVKSEGDATNFVPIVVGVRLGG
jgi:hypothetical protein